MRGLVRVAPRSPLVRTWPYPYLGTLAVSNDADFCRFDFFEAFMKFCNTTSVTPFGTGLGLELTSSVFGFSEPKRQFACFAGTAVDAPASPEATRISDYLSAGWIDANHAFGDFDGVGGFTRAHAQRALDFLSRCHGDVRVFINHGDAENRQCVGAGASHHDGDRPGSQAYHADLWARQPPVYVTTSANVTGSAAEPPARPTPRSWIGRLAPRARATPLLEDLSLQDGTLVHGFLRLRATGHNAPNLSSLTSQVRLVDFERLYRRGLAVVLYQHWGVLHRAAGTCVSATVESVSSRLELLCGLRHLAREQGEGRLWVPGLLRLLDYALLVSTTDVVPGATPGVFEIRSAAPRLPRLDGLTVYVDPRVRVRLVHNGVPVPTVHNGPDQTGRYSVTVPCRRRDDIW